MKKAIYPGSFDPLTLGHVDIIKRASNIVDELVVGVLNNSAKNSLFSLDERVSMIKEMTKDFPNVSVTSFDGLLVEHMKQIDATIIVRGLRAVTDFEYELQIAQTNHVENPEVETIFLTTSLQYSYLSSTIVKEFASYGGDISKFVPAQFINGGTGNAVVLDQSVGAFRRVFQGFPKGIIPDHHAPPPLCFNDMHQVTNLTMVVKKTILCISGIFRRQA